MSNKKRSKATDLGWELGEIRSQMNELQARNKYVTALFKKALSDEGVPEAGGYRLTKDPYGKLVVVDWGAAEAWVSEYPAARKIDTGVAHEIFQLSHGDPTKHGFAYAETERVVAVKDVDQE